MIEAFVLGDGLLCQPQEGGRPLHVLSELENGGIGGEVAVGQHEMTAQPLKLEPVVLPALRDQLFDGVGGRLLIHPVKAEQTPLAHEPSVGLT